MKVARTKLVRVLAKRFSETGDYKQLAEETAAYLLAENRVSELDSILRDIQEYRAQHGVVEVTAISAFPLAVDVKADIKRTVQTIYPAAKQIIISEQHDETAIGGVRLELANQRLDLSIRTQLNKFKQLTTAGKD